VTGRVDAAAKTDARKPARTIGVRFGMVALDYRFARAVVRHPGIVLALFALLLAPAAVLALRVESDNSVDRLIVEDDADAKETRAFQALFPEGDYVVLLAEADDPYAPAVLSRVEEIERALTALGPSVRPLSAIAVWRGSGGSTDFKTFATGTDLLRRQGLVGDGVLYRGRPAATSPLRPVADLQFRRTERLHAEWTPAGELDQRSARLLSRTGQPLPIPVAVTERDVAGRKVLAADLNLAPLAAGDYVIELTAGRGGTQTTRLLAFRVLQ